MNKVKSDEKEGSTGSQKHKLRSQKPNTTEDLPKGKQNTSPTDQNLASKEADKEINMDKLMKYIKESQEKSERTLMKAIEGSKCEINEKMESMVETLTERVGSVRADLTKVEQTFEQKVKKLQENLGGLNANIKDAKEKLGILDQSTKNDKDVIMRRIKNIEADLETVQKKHKTECEGLRREMSNFISDQKERMAKCESSLEQIKEFTSENVDDIKYNSQWECK